MKIIVDAFGGDNAPLEVLKGVSKAVTDFGINIILTGDNDVIKSTAAEHNISLDGISVIDTKVAIDIHDEPSMVIKEKSGCSMALGLKELAEGGGDAFVSAGSTGALVVGATVITKRIKGIKRAALAPILPSAKGSIMLIDAGANVDCRPEMLVQFAIMGSCYMQNVMGISSPKVGLLNVGTENTKGRDIEIEAYLQLKKAPVNFYGNLEARDVPFGECDIIVSDGFTGNIALKLYEGMGSYFSHTLKDMLTSGLNGKIAALLIMPKIKAFKKKMDYAEAGGAMLLGISKPVIKAHGSSDAKAFYHAVRQAKNSVEGKFIDKIAKTLESLHP